MRLKDADEIGHARAIAAVGRPNGVRIRVGPAAPDPFEHFDDQLHCREHIAGTVR
jgi:hypothetical protein